MITKVINEFGKEINFEVAVELMDDELREEIAATGDYDNDSQGFFMAYCEAHERKFGEEFELAKENPQY